MKPSTRERYADALEVYARSTSAEAAKVAGISQSHMTRIAKAAGVKCGHRAQYRPGMAAYVEGCRCDECSRLSQPYIDAAGRYLDGDATLQELGDELGVTRERVRQAIHLYVGEAAFDIRRARRAEREAIAAEVEEQKRIVRAEREGVTCSVCGSSHARTYGDGWAVTCSSECSEMWEDVRYLTAEGHEAHRRRVASWNLRHPDAVNDALLRMSRRIRVGLEPEYAGQWQYRKRRRWVQPGSRRFEIAVRAYREGWPAFETWHEDIQEQIREHVAEQEAA